MLNEIYKEISESLIFFFIVFCLLCLCHVANKQAIHDQAVYDAMFICYDVPVPDGFSKAMIKTP